MAHSSQYNYVIPPQLRPTNSTIFLLFLMHYERSACSDLKLFFRTSLCSPPPLDPRSTVTVTNYTSERFNHVDP
jgi:hypothetical protein